MTFDKSKVYTALNAEELEVGSEVILSDCLELLQAEVEANSWPTFVRRLDGVMSTSSTNRFKSSDKIYNLAYLVRKPDEEKSEEEKWIAYLAMPNGNGCYLTACAEDAWNEVKQIFGAKTKLFVGTKSEVVAWYKARQKFTEIIKAWEDGKELQFRPRDPHLSWQECGNPSWDVDLEYRVKPYGLVWTDLKVGNILLRAGERPALLGAKHEYAYVEERRMVTGIVDDPGTKRHVQLGGDWIDDDDLEKWGIAE